MAVNYEAWNILSRCCGEMFHVVCFMLHHPISRTGMVERFLFGRVTVKTPERKTALASSARTSTGRMIERENEPQ